MIFNIYNKATSEEQQNLRDYQGKKYAAYRDKLNQKYFGKYYKEYENLSPVIKNIINELYESANGITEHLIECGDCYITEVHKTHEKCRKLKLLMNKGEI
jgi:hypothetical protein